MKKYHTSPSLPARVAACATLMCFSYSFILHEPAMAVAAVAAERSAARSMKTALESAVIPSRYGRVTGMHEGDSSRLVVYVQDLHCNPEVQSNIAAILGMFDTQYGIRRIYVEGAPAGRLDSALLSSIPDDTIRDKTIEGLLSKGLLSGAEYYAVKFRQEKLCGLEEWDIYRANLARYRTLAARKNESAAAIANFRSEISVLNEKYLDRKIKRTRKVLAAGRQETRYLRMEKLGERLGHPLAGYPNLARYVTALKTRGAVRYSRVNDELARFLKDLRARVPLAEYNALTQSMNDPDARDAFYIRLADIVHRAGTPMRGYPHLTRFLAYLELNYQINPVQLLAEERLFTRRVMDESADRKLDHDLLLLSRMSEDAGDYVGLTMTPDQYRGFSTDKQQFMALVRKYCDAATARETIAVLSDESYQEFYASNIRRNDIFLKSLSSKDVGSVATSAHQPQSSDASGSMLTRLNRFGAIDFVIAGGFHMEMAKLLKSKNISYLVITPGMTRRHDAGVYEQVMTGKIDYRAIAASALAPVVASCLQANDVRGTVEESRLVAMVEQIVTAAFAQHTSPERIQELVAHWQAGNPLLKDISLSFANGRISIYLSVNGTKKHLFSLENRGNDVQFISGEGPGEISSPVTDDLLASVSGTVTEIVRKVRTDLSDLLGSLVPSAEAPSVSAPTGRVILFGGDEDSPSQDTPGAAPAALPDLVVPSAGGELPATADHIHAGRAHAEKQEIDLIIQSLAWLVNAVDSDNGKTAVSAYLPLLARLLYNEVTIVERVRLLSELNELLRPTGIEVIFSQRPNSVGLQFYGGRPGTTKQIVADMRSIPIAARRSLLFMFARAETTDVPRWLWVDSHDAAGQASGMCSILLNRVLNNTGEDQRIDALLGDIQDGKTKQSERTHMLGFSRVELVDVITSSLGRAAHASGVPTVEIQALAHVLVALLFDQTVDRSHSRFMGRARRTRASLEPASPLVVNTLKGLGSSDKELHAFLVKKSVAVRIMTGSFLPGQHTEDDLAFASIAVDGNTIVLTVREDFWRRILRGPPELLGLLLRHELKEYLYLARYPEKTFMDFHDETRDEYTSLFALMENQFIKDAYSRAQNTVHSGAAAMIISNVAAYVGIPSSTLSVALKQLLEEIAGAPINEYERKVVLMIVSAYTLGMLHEGATDHLVSSLDKVVPVKRKAKAHKLMPQGLPRTTRKNPVQLPILGSGFCATAFRMGGYTVKYMKSITLADEAQRESVERLGRSIDYGIFDGRLDMTIWEYIRSVDKFPEYIIPTKIFIAQDAYGQLDEEERYQLKRFIKAGIVVIMPQALYVHSDDFNTRRGDTVIKGPVDGIVAVSVAVVQPAVTPVNERIGQCLSAGRIDEAKKIVAQYVDFIKNAWGNGVFLVDASINNIGIDSDGTIKAFDVQYGRIDPVLGRPIQLDQLQVTYGANQYHFGKFTDEIRSYYHTLCGYAGTHRDIFNEETLLELWKYNVSLPTKRQVRVVLHHALIKKLLMVLRGEYSDTETDAALIVSSTHGLPDDALRAGIKMHKGRPVIFPFNHSGEIDPSTRKAWGRIAMPCEALGILSNDDIVYHFKDLFTGETYARSGRELHVNGLEVGLAPYRVHALRLENVTITPGSVLERILNESLRAHYHGDFRGTYEHKNTFLLSAPVRALVHVLDDRHGANNLSRSLDVMPLHEDGEVYLRASLLSVHDVPHIIAVNSTGQASYEGKSWGAVALPLRELGISDSLHAVYVFTDIFSGATYQKTGKELHEQGGIIVGVQPYGMHMLRVERKHHASLDAAHWQGRTRGGDETQRGAVNPSLIMPSSLQLVRDMRREGKGWVEISRAVARLEMRRFLFHPFSFAAAHRLSPIAAIPIESSEGGLVLNAAAVEKQISERLAVVNRLLDEWPVESGEFRELLVREKSALERFAVALAQEVEDADTHQLYRLFTKIINERKHTVEALLQPYLKTSFLAASTGRDLKNGRKFDDIQRRIPSARWLYRELEILTTLFADANKAYSHRDDSEQKRHEDIRNASRTAQTAMEALRNSIENRIEEIKASLTANPAGDAALLDEKSMLERQHEAMQQYAFPKDTASLHDMYTGLRRVVQRRKLHVETALIQRDAAALAQAEADKVHVAEKQRDARERIVSTIRSHHQAMRVSSRQEIISQDRLEALLHEWVMLDTLWSEMNDKKVHNDKRRMRELLLIVYGKILELKRMPGYEQNFKGEDLYQLLGDFCETRKRLHASADIQMGYNSLLVPQYNDYVRRHNAGITRGVRAIFTASWGAGIAGAAGLASAAAAFVVPYVSSTPDPVLVLTGVALVTIVSAAALWIAAQANIFLHTRWNMRHAEHPLILGEDGARSDSEGPHMLPSGDITAPPDYNEMPFPEMIPSAYSAYSDYFAERFAMLQRVFIDNTAPHTSLPFILSTGDRPVAEAIKRFLAVLNPDDGKAPNRDALQDAYRIVDLAVFEFETRYNAFAAQYNTFVQKGSSAKGWLLSKYSPSYNISVPLGYAYFTEYKILFEARVSAAIAYFEQIMPYATFSGQIANLNEAYVRLYGTIDKCEDYYAGRAAMQDGRMSPKNNDEENDLLSRLKNDNESLMRSYNTLIDAYNTWASDKGPSPLTRRRGLSDRLGRLPGGQALRAAVMVFEELVAAPAWELAKFAHLLQLYLTDNNAYHRQAQEFVSKHTYRGQPYTSQQLQQASRGLEQIISTTADSHPLVRLPLLWARHLAYNYRHGTIHKDIQSPIAPLSASDAAGLPKIESGRDTMWEPIQFPDDWIIFGFDDYIIAVGKQMQAVLRLLAGEQVPASINISDLLLEGNAIQRALADHNMMDANPVEYIRRIEKDYNRFITNYNAFVEKLDRILRAGTQPADSKDEMFALKQSLPLVPQLPLPRDDWKKSAREIYVYCSDDLFDFVSQLPVEVWNASVDNDVSRAVNDRRLDMVYAGSLIAQCDSREDFNRQYKNIVEKNNAFINFCATLLEIHNLNIQKLKPLNMGSRGHQFAPPSELAAYDSAELFAYYTALDSIVPVLQREFLRRNPAGTPLPGMLVNGSQHIQDTIDAYRAQSKNNPSPDQIWRLISAITTAHEEFVATYNAFVSQYNRAIEVNIAAILATVDDPARPDLVKHYLDDSSETGAVDQDESGEGAGPLTLPARHSRRMGSSPVEQALRSAVSAARELLVAPVKELALFVMLARLYRADKQQYYSQAYHFVGLHRHEGVAYTDGQQSTMVAGLTDIVARASAAGNPFMFIARLWAGHLAYNYRSGTLSMLKGRRSAPSPLNAHQGAPQTAANGGLDAIVMRGNNGFFQQTEYLLPWFPGMISLRLRGGLSVAVREEITGEVEFTDKDGAAETFPLVVRDGMLEVPFVLSGDRYEAGKTYPFKLRIRTQGKEHVLAGRQPVETPTDEQWSAMPVARPIVPGKIYLGNARAVGTPGFLAGRGIKAVLNAAEERDTRYYADDGMAYAQFNFSDFSNNPMDEALLWQAVQWMHEQISAGRPVFVHCHAGIGRSSSVVVAYLALVLYPEKNYDEIVAMVRREKPDIYPHLGMADTVGRLKTAHAKDLMRMMRRDDYPAPEEPGTVTSVSFDGLKPNEHMTGRVGQSLTVRARLAFSGTAPRGVRLRTNINRVDGNHEEILMQRVGDSSVYEARIIPRRKGAFWATVSVTPNAFDHYQTPRTWVSGDQHNIYIDVDNPAPADVSAAAWQGTADLMADMFLTQGTFPSVPRRIFEAMAGFIASALKKHRGWFEQAVRHQPALFGQRSVLLYIPQWDGVSLTPELRYLLDHHMNPVVVTTDDRNGRTKGEPIGRVLTGSTTSDVYRKEYYKKVLDGHTYEDGLTVLTIVPRRTNGAEAAQGLSDEEIWDGLVDLLHDIHDGMLADAVAHPWLVMGAHLSSEQAGQVPAVMAEKPFSEAIDDRGQQNYFEALMAQYADAAIGEGSAVLSRPASGVSRGQAAVMVQAPVGTLIDPSGVHTNGTAAAAQNFARLLRQRGISTIGLDGIVTVTPQGVVSVTGMASEQFEALYAALGVASGSTELILPLTVPAGAASPSLVHNLAALIAAHPGVGVRIRFEDSSDMRKSIDALGAALFGAHVPAETTVLIDCNDADQRAVVTSAAARYGVRMVPLGDPAQAVEISIGTDVNETSEQFQAALRATQAALVVVNMPAIPLAGETESLNFYDILSVLNMYLASRRTCSPEEARLRGRRIAHSTLQTMGQVTRADAAPIARTLMQILANKENGRMPLHNFADKISGPDYRLPDQQFHKLYGAVEYILWFNMPRRGAVDIERIRSEMLEGFVKELLGEMLVLLVPEYDQLDRVALERTGQLEILKEGLVSLATAGQQDDLLVNIASAYLGLVASGGTVNLETVRDQVAEHASPVIRYYALRTALAMANVRTPLYQAVLKDMETTAKDMAGTSEMDVGDTLAAARALAASMVAARESSASAEEVIAGARHQIAMLMSRENLPPESCALLMLITLDLLNTDARKGLLDTAAQSSQPALRAITMMLSAA